MYAFDELFIVNYESLSGQPLLLPVIRIHAVTVHSHLAYNTLRILHNSEAVLFSILLSALNVFEFAFVVVMETLVALAHVVHKTMFQEESSSYRVYCLAVHLLNILDVAANRDLVCRLYQAHPRENTQMTHLFNSERDLTMSRSRQARLETIIQLA